MAMIIDRNEIWLTGFVGGDWWEDGFTSDQVVYALSTIGRNADIVIHLNSGGGYASEGMAIHAQLKAHKGRCEIIVEGIAASAASVVAMAADHLVMSLGAVMMIHDPMVDTFGDVEDHQKSIEYLNALGVSFANVYADKTGKSADEMRALMQAETWMTADEAVAAGFADATAAASPKAANDNVATAFAYRAYAHAPGQLVALADAKGWPREFKAVATARTSPKPEDRTMTNPANPNPPAPPANPAPVAANQTEAEAAVARVQNILDHPEAVGREATARALAFGTKNTVDEAVAILKSIPKGAPPAAPNPVAQLAGQVATVHIGAEPTAPSGDTQRKAVNWAEIHEGIAARNGLKAPK